MNLSTHIPIILIATPILVAALMILLRKQPGIQKAISVAVSFAMLILSVILLSQVWSGGIQAYEVGEWGKYGIILVADLLSSGMVVLTSFVSFLALIYSLDYIEKKSLSASYYPLFSLLVAGLNGSFLTGDIFNLFVFFEILLLSSCGLVIANEQGGVTKSSDKMEATFKYLVLNMVSSIVMLIAVSSLYATTGTLNMADISVKLSAMSAAGTLPWHVFAIALMFVVVFGNKAAIFPLHYWLPDVHPTAPSPISAMLSGVLIKVGAYGMLRVFFLIFIDTLDIFKPVIMYLALATIVVGAISAVAQTDVKRLLAYSSVSQIGYVFLGISFGSIYGITAALVYLVNHAIAKSMLFLTSGGIIHHAGTRDMRKMGGMVDSAPLMSLMFLVGAMSIAGMPPLGGFIAKLSLFDAGIGEQYYFAIGIALFFAIFTLFYMFRAMLLMFWGEKRDVEKYGEYSHHGTSFLMALPIVVLALTVVAFGVYAEPLIALANATAHQILDPQPYIDAVMTRVVR
ncbi:MAG: multicomponent Na+:H+ antiporter subunit [Methanolobus sp.]|jgi:multicomponent Na+:H+ antiporter subunit D|uniref:Multisubunit sodium/proton antiporter, MrpD subunit n=1 Tax=Methanolobus tindarius DSM 2278 TaxID=1090322 RepID=W9DR42_METTI|nr:NADH-quinone oxidoreductase subunit M [Methanolobus tindarius]ETA69159.1 multisubunit sodium/proton antiporter, MrpD subunit [Methanolobus tindarius DSM 2278]MDI3485643.1 multicomponent Na+:H+ antiporter subunit [Methanolobus sp.]MDK2937854.1 multicomponent Na+:H+ antiporter subunit [Methanolobus sp.]